MILWARGESKKAPSWLVYLLLAEEWKMSPEDIESKVSAQWIDRWLALQEGRAKAMPKPKSSSQGGITRKVY